MKDSWRYWNCTESVPEPGEALLLSVDLPSVSSRNRLIPVWEFGPSVQGEVRSLLFLAPSPSFGGGEVFPIAGFVRYHYNAGP